MRDYFPGDLYNHPQINQTLPASELSRAPRLDPLIDSNQSTNSNKKQSEQEIYTCSSLSLQMCQGAHARFWWNSTTFNPKASGPWNKAPCPATQPEGWRNAEFRSEGRHPRSHETEALRCLRAVRCLRLKHREGVFQAALGLLGCAAEVEFAAPVFRSFRWKFKVHEGLVTASGLHP